MKAHDERFTQLVLACYRGVYTATNADGRHVETRMFEYELADGVLIWGNTAAFYEEARARLGLAPHPWGYSHVHKVLRDHGERLHAAGERQHTGWYTGQHRPQEALEWLGGAPGAQRQPALTPALARVGAATASVATVVRACYAGLTRDGRLHFHLNGDDCATEGEILTTFKLKRRALLAILRDRLPLSWLVDQVTIEAAA